MTSLTDAVIAGSGGDSALPPSLYDIEREESLVKRYQRKDLFRNELTLEFSKEKDLIHQYYKIRESEFISVLGTYNYSGVETKHDKDGQIFIMRQGNFCVGGARFNVKTPRRPNLLPLEIDDFRIEDHFPHLRDKQISYGQLGMFAVLPEYRSLELSRRGFSRVLKKAASLNVEVVFCVSPLVNSRLYRQDCIALGMTGTKIHLDIELPVYPTLEEVKLYLLSIPVNKAALEDSSGPVKLKENSDFEKEADLQHI